MDRKAIAEIRKLLTKSGCRIDKLAGCFVSEDGEVIAELKETFHALPEEEAEGYLDLLRRVLSGKPGRNLFEMEFPLSEEQAGGRQAKLYSLLRSDHKDSAQLAEFFGRLVSTLDRAGRHLILLARGTYDIPSKASDGTEMEDASDYVYEFLVCAVCPVTEISEGLCYDAQTLHFVSKKSDLGVQAPVLGFLYPAFNDRLPDIHQILYYAKNEDERHIELIDEIVGAEEIPQTQSMQQDSFTDLVEQTLGRHCDFDTVKLLTETVNEMISEEKDSPDPLELGAQQMRRILKDSCADAPDTVEENFERVFNNTIGEGRSVAADNIGGRSVMEIKSPSVKITVKSDMTALITTRILNGREFLLIPVQDDIEVNGIRILPRTFRGADAGDEE